MLLPPPCVAVEPAGATGKKHVQVCAVLFFFMRLGAPEQPGGRGLLGRERALAHTPCRACSSKPVFRDRRFEDSPKHGGVFPPYACLFSSSGVGKI